MANVVNDLTVENIIEASGFKVAQGIPNATAVYNVNPRDYPKLTTWNAVATVTGDATIFTSSTSRRTFIVGVVFDYYKNATCNVATGQLTVNYVQNGQTKVLLGAAVLTATGQQAANNTAQFPPLLVDKGTAVTVTGTYGAGTMIRSVTVYGFELPDA